MPARMRPDDRREQILETAHAAIAADGFQSLSLRELARRCGISAPGLMHYFPDMESLLHAVLERRDELDLTAILDQAPADVGLLGIIDTAIDYYSERRGESARFDALEAEALDPAHPAHDYFVRRDDRNFARLRPIVEREYDDPDSVARILRLVFDGLRVRWVRRDSPGTMRDSPGTMLADWQAIRGPLFDGFARAQRKARRRRGSRR